MFDFYTKYDQQFEFYCKSATSVIVSPSSKTRRRFTQKKKEEVHLHYSNSVKFVETAKSFSINESMARGMVKARPVPHNIKLSSKCNFTGAGNR